jgi:hypothetical protein
MDFQSQTPAVVAAIRQRDLLITWCRLYAGMNKLPNLTEYLPSRLKEEANDLVYYSVDAATWPSPHDRK